MKKRFLIIVQCSLIIICLFMIRNVHSQSNIDSKPPEAEPMVSPQEMIPSLQTGLQVILAPAPDAPLWQWTPQGPGPTLNGQVENIPGGNLVVGAVHTIVAHPTNPDIVYLVGVNGGIWRTTKATDANPHWIPLTDQQQSLSIGALEFDPTDPTNQTLVAGIGRYSNFGNRGGPLTGLLRTTDGGNTWVQLGQADLAGRNISGVGPRGNTILVSVDSKDLGTSPGMYRSTNGGATFQFISGINGLNNGPVFDLLGDPSNQNRFYAGVGGANGGVFRTDDSGANWTDVTDAAIGALVGGATDNIELAIHNAVTNAVYVGICNNGQLAGVFRSANTGGAWTAMDLPQTNEGGNIVGIHPGGQCGNNLSIVADPTNASIVYVGGDRQPSPFPNSIGANDFSGRLFRGDASITPTGGVPSPQWTPLTHSGTASNSSPHADSREMVFDANGDIIEGDDGGIYRRSNPQSGAGNWQSVIGDLQVTEFHDIAYDTNSKILLGGAQDTGTPQQVTTGGTTWDSVSTADGGDVAVDNITLAGVNQSIRYSSNQNLGGFRRRTYDAANVLQSQVFPALTVVGGGAALVRQFVTPIELNKIDPTHLIVGGGNSTYESLDQGNTITEVGPGIGVNRPHAIAYGGSRNGTNDPDILYVGSGNQVFIRTIAGGPLNATSALPSGAGTVLDIVLDPEDWMTAYVIDNNQVFVTNNAGANWTDVTGNLIDANLQTVEFVPSTIDFVFVGGQTGVSVMRVNNPGVWGKAGTGLPNAVAFELVYDRVDNILVAGTLGRGAWLINEVSVAPQIQVPGSVDFGNTCVGSTSVQTLDVCNTGKADLEVKQIASSDPQFMVTTPISLYPVVISPDFCFPFQVRFTPTSTGTTITTLTIASNDPANPSVTVQETGNGTQQNIATMIADNGDFGDVCLGSYKDIDLTLSNSGGCDLSVTGITSSSPEFQTANVLSYPLVIHAGDSVQVPIRLKPASLGSKSADITISSNDPDTPSKVVAVSGNTPPGDIRVTGSTNFGDVCAETQAEKTVSVCNVGKCNLAVTSVAFNPPCADFTLINNPFPAAVSPDSCNDVVIRFTPTSAGPKTCTLVISSDDPDSSGISLTVTANTPLASIDVPPDQSFSPEVIQSAGMCQSQKPFPISNTGTCNLNITNITIGGVNRSDYALSGLPSFPVILEPGHVAGEGNLNTVFAPTAIDRDRLGNMTVTYVSDPITGATTDVTRELCGEGVLTGARILVKAAGVPLPMVEKIQIQRITGNRNKSIVDTVDVAKNLPLQTETPSAPCASFQYHREYGTISNQIQLLPGSYRVTATAIVNGKRKSKTVAFDVSTCDFNPNIVVNF